MAKAQQHGAFTEKTYTTQNGLPSKAVFAIAEDKLGFLWLATLDGVVRFDGTKFTHFGKRFPKANEFSKNTATRVVMIDSFAYFFGAELRLVNIYTQQTKTYSYGYNGKDSILLTETFAAHKDKKGRLWLGTSGQGVFMHDAKSDTWQRVKFPDYVKEREYKWVTNFCEKPNGDIYFPTLNGIVRYAANDSVFLYSYASKTRSNYNVRTFIADVGCKDSFLVKQDEVGYSYFNLKTHILQPIQLPMLSLDAMQLLQLDLTNTVLCIKEPFVVKSNKASGLHVVKYNNELIGSLYRAADKSLWLSTTTTLIHLRKGPQAQFSMEDSRISFAPTYFDKASGTYYQLSSYNPTQVYTFSATRPQLIPYGRAFDRKLMHVVKAIRMIGDTLYISSFRGLFKYNRNMAKPVPVTVPKNLIGAYYTSQKLILNKDKLIISGIFDGPVLLNVKDGTYKLLKQNSAENPKDHTVSNCIASCADKQGNFYVAQPYTDSIIKFDYDGNILEYFVMPNVLKESAPRAYNTDMEVDRLGNIWVFVQNKGLYKYTASNRQWRSMYDETYADIVTTEELTYDGAQSLYLAGQVEIYKVDIVSDKFQRIDLQYMHERSDKRYTNFIVTDSTQFLILDDGGLLRAFAMEKSAAKTKPILYAENLAVMGEQVQSGLLDSLIVLNAGQNAFSLNFGIASIYIANPINYFAQLEGVDKQWRALGNNTSINYAGLSPGKYLLRLKALSISDEFAATERSFVVIVKAAWHQTWLFRLLCVALAGALVYYLLRQRFRQQLAAQKAEASKQLALLEERSRIAADMHDELGAGLSQIRFASNEALDVKDEQQLQAILARNKKNSDELVDKMNDIIWSLNSTEENTEDMLSHMRSVLAAFVTEQDMAFKFDVSEEVYALQLSAALKKNLYLTIKEAVHNAVKYSKASAIAISISKQGNQIAFAVQDNGIGFEVGKGKLKGNGITNYYRRAEAMGGTIDLHSDSSGTVLKGFYPLA
ncbi:MAG: hypothetical protein RL660_669 [Bacteroidota bacterium]